MDAKQILDIPMADNDSGEHTIRGYLKALLRTLWSETEGFSGKRPFGNSGWEFDLYKPLVEAGAVKGKIEDGYIDNVDEKAANAAIFSAIDALQ